MKPDCVAKGNDDRASNILMVAVNRELITGSEISDFECECRLWTRVKVYNPPMTEQQNYILNINGGGGFTYKLRLKCALVAVKAKLNASTKLRTIFKLFIATCHKTA